jgi:Xaa-Pro aminopeptidase
MFEARFQTFDVERSSEAELAGRLALLRAELSRRGLDGFIVPRADAHQNENVPPSEERLKWLTGFSGSAGSAIVLADRAALFVDGRYTLQAREQVPGLFSLEHVTESPPEGWVQANLKQGGKLGYDPWLLTASGAEKFRNACGAAGGVLLPTEPNPIDSVWSDRPAPPLGRVMLHDLPFAGEPARAKIERIQSEIAKDSVEAAVVSDPQAIAWTFNIRGSDVAHTPVPLAFAIIPAKGRPALFLDGRKLGNEVRAYLEDLADVSEPQLLRERLDAVARTGGAVWLDEATAADALAKIVADSGGRLNRGPDPIARMKAIKNAVEIAGARAAHRRDGAAVAKFLAWLDREASKGELSEIDAVAAMETFRRESGALKDVSFPSIAGSGRNGAIVHYRVTRASNRRLSAGELFLIDSGGQYEDGTTDITRTVAIGTPTAEMRERYARVLRGHIAIATARFPEGTTGAQLDSFARRYLWQAGLDFDHGTGHGVGSYLSVHEGPARISKLGTTPLERGMILSNEPGYYKTNGYGIRIENLVLVVEAPPPPGAEKRLNSFETLTLAPFDLRLVDVGLLELAEIAWIDDYHLRVREALTPLLDDETGRWLRHATRSLANA